jgi:outer membrane protein assembly factor BamA
VRVTGLRADVVFAVTEGEPTRLRSVAVTGNEKTASSFVTRELVVRPGDLVRRRKIVESQKGLFETGLFRDVRIHSMIADSVPGVVDLAVNVRERRPAWLGFGVGYSSRDLARLSAEWGHRNIGGAGRRLAAATRFGLSLDTLFVKGTFPPLGESVTELSWTEPWFLGTRTPLQTGAYHRFQTQRTFEQTILGLKSTARRNLSTTARLFFTLENRWVFTTDSTQVRESYQSRLMDVRSERDTRDNLFDPRSGTVQQGLLEYAGGFLGGQSTFAKASISGAWYETLRPGLVVAWRLQMGLIEPIRSELGAGEGGLAVLDVPFEDRFRLGGANTVRGYAEQQLGRTVVVSEKTQPLGGLAMYLANVEVRFHLFWLFSGALFADSGTVWSDRREVKPERLVGELDGGAPSVLDVKYGVGGGLRFLTPVGPVRVDYGRKIGSSRTLAARPHEWHLSVGQAF